MTTGRDPQGRYTVIDDELNFIVIQQPKAIAAKMLREQFTSLRADAILNNLASESDWRRVFLAAAKQRSKT